MTKSGRERVAVLLVENLSVPFDRRVWQEALALRSAGFEVHVICPASKSNPRRRETLNGITIRRYPPGVEGKGLFGIALEYANALVWQIALSVSLRLRVRVTHAHVCNPPDLLFLPGLVFRMTGAALIFDHHDANPELLVAKGYRQGGLYYRVARILERITFRCADVTIATNESYREIATSRGGKDGADVFVVRSGPDESRFGSLTAAPIASVCDAVSRGDHVVAYVGVMGRQEGIHELLDVAERLVVRRGRRDIRFVLAGSGPEWASVVLEAKRRGISDWFVMLGRIPDAELKYLLTNASVCVNPDIPSAMNDISTMNKVMEYMLFSKPIVQYDLHEGRVSADQAALYAAPGDIDDFATKIEQLCDDQVDASRRGAFGAQRYARSLKWEQQVPALLAAYDRATIVRSNRAPATTSHASS